MLVEPERGGRGGFSSSTSVDREQWDSSFDSVLCDRDMPCLSDCHRKEGMEWGTMVRGKWDFREVGTGRNRERQGPGKEGIFFSSLHIYACVLCKRVDTC